MWKAALDNNDDVIDIPIDEKKNINPNCNQSQ